MKTYHSFSSGETKRFGKKLAESIAKRKAPASLELPAKGEARQGRRRGEQSAKRDRACVVALSGELGSGKTTFVQGFLRGLGIRKRSPSPTFIIFRRFTIHVSRFKNLYHVDAYRIKKPNELLALGFRGVVSDQKNIVLIEWADKIKRALPKSALWLNFSHGGKENERAIAWSREFPHKLR